MWIPAADDEPSERYEMKGGYTIPRNNFLQGYIRRTPAEGGGDRRNEEYEKRMRRGQRTAVDGRRMKINADGMMRSAIGGRRRKFNGDS